MIRRFLGCLILMLIGFNSHSQVKTVMMDVKDRITADSAEAVNYAVYGKIPGDSVYTFKKFDYDGILLASGSFKDDSLQIPHGKFVYYNWITPDNNVVSMGYDINGKERFIEVTGSFNNGLREGRWLSFYSDGKIKEIVTFSKGIVHGAYQSFNVEGKQQIAGLYVRGKKNGTWILKGGKQQDRYENGQLISSLKGKKLREQQAQGKIVN